MALFEPQPLYDTLVEKFGFDPSDLASDMGRYVNGVGTPHHRYYSSTAETVQPVTGQMVILSEGGGATVLPLVVGRRPAEGWAENSTVTPLAMPKRRSAG